MQATLFTNFSSQSFTWRWDGQEYTFLPGQSVYMEDYKAAHFAKHLVDRELGLQNKLTNDHSRSALLNNCFIGNPPKPKVDGEEVKDSAAETEIININLNHEAKADEPKADSFCDSCDSKGVRHKKECPKGKKKEDEFEGA